MVQYLDYSGRRECPEATRGEVVSFETLSLSLRLEGTSPKRTRVTNFAHHGRWLV